MGAHLRPIFQRNLDRHSPRLRLMCLVGAPSSYRPEKLLLCVFVCARYQSCPQSTVIDSALWMFLLITLMLYLLPSKYITLPNPCLLMPFSYEFHLDVFPTRFYLFLCVMRKLIPLSVFLFELSKPFCFNLPLRADKFSWLMWLVCIHIFFCFIFCIS